MDRGLIGGILRDSLTNSQVETVWVDHSPTIKDARLRLVWYSRRTGILFLLLDLNPTAHDQYMGYNAGPNPSDSFQTDCPDSMAIDCHPHLILLVQIGSNDPDLVTNLPS
jgi:hypothetical protein